MVFIPLELVCDTPCENGYNHTYIYVDTAGRVHTAYHRKLNGKWQVFYRMRGTSGWEPEERVVFTDTADAKYPSVAVLRDTVFLVWHDYRVGGISNVEIFFNYRPLNGTWSSDQRLTFTNAGNNGDNGYVPTLKISPDGNLRVVWYDYRDDPYAYNAQIYTKVRDSGGWNPDVRVSNSSGNAWYPSFDFGPADSVIYVWSDNRDGFYKIYGSFGHGDFPLSTSEGYYPDVVHAHGKYVVVWQSPDGILISRFQNGVWSPPLHLKPSPNPQKNPDITHFPGGFVVVWREDYDFYTSSVVGVVLDTSLNVLDSFRITNSGIQSRPVVVVDNRGYMHVAFVDYTLGGSKPRIFYTRSVYPLTLSEIAAPRNKNFKPSKRIAGRRVILGGRYTVSGRSLR